jgi:hypothetical protein
MSQNGQPGYVTPPPPTPPKRRRGPWIAGTAMALVAAGLTTFFALGPRSAEPAAAAPPTSDAQPYVRDFANQLSGDVKQPLPSAEPYSYGPTVDGCDHDYGVRGECVPYNFPPGVANTPAAKCAWLATQKFRNLEVPGQDRHKLVPAGGPKAAGGNPYACPAELPTG